MGAPCHLYSNAARLAIIVVGAVDLYGPLRHDLYSRLYHPSHLAVPVPDQSITGHGKNLDGSSLSIWTLVIQTNTSILLGISWMHRLGPRGKGFNRVPNGIVDPFTWYYISSWPYINNIILGVGQGVLVLIYLYQMLRTQPGGLQNSRISATTESTALLA